jgi:GT2 family glycosyltransferase
MSGRIRLYDPSDYPSTINESTERAEIAGWCLDPGIVQGANMAFRRRALDQVGFFDPDFGAGTPFAGEDWELALRLSAAGWEGGYFPEPVVWHHHGRKATDYPALFRFYRFGEGAVYAKGLLDPSMRWRLAGYWLRRIAGDLIKRRSAEKVLLVAQGALAYWKLRYQRRRTPRCGHEDVLL